MKNLVIRLIVVLIFLICAIVVISKAPQYELEYKYKDGDLRVILNDTEITRDTSKLPEVASIVNGEIMLSSNTIDILFDKDLYYEEKHDTFITTNGTHRADITIGSHTIKVDGEERTVKVPAFSTTYDFSKDDRYKNSSNKKEVYYIPISALVGVYDIRVEFTDKVIITNPNINLSQFTITDDSPVEIKYSGDTQYKTIETASQGDLLYVFNYNSSDKFSRVRTQEGELGFVSNDIIKKYSMDTLSTKSTPQVKTSQNITLVWDYINPIHTTIGEKANRSKNYKIDVVSPTLLYMENSNGDIHYSKNALSEYMSWAKACGYDVWITLKNEKISENKNFTIKDTSEFLNDMNSRNKTISQLITICRANSIQGIDIDFENMYKEDATAFSQFIRELAVECKNNNLKLCVCTNVPDGSDTWSLCYQHKALSEAADYIALMTYDYSRNAVSSFAPYGWVEENIKKVVDRDGVESTKLLLGISFGSAYWSVKNSVPSRSIISMSSAKKYVSDNWDLKLHQYFYENESKGEYVYVEDATSIKDKLAMIKEYNLGGSGAWQLGQETSDVWEAYSD